MQLQLIILHQMDPGRRLLAERSLGGNENDNKGDKLKLKLPTKEISRTELNIWIFTHPPKISVLVSLMNAGLYCNFGKENVCSGSYGYIYGYGYGYG